MNWKAGPPGLKLTIMAIVAASVSSENTSAITLASCVAGALVILASPGGGAGHDREHQRADGRDRAC